MEAVINILEEESERMEACRAECSQLSNKSIDDEEFKRLPNLFSILTQYRTTALKFRCNAL